MHCAIYEKYGPLGNLNNNIEMDLLKEIQLFIPPLTCDSHKGQAGRIGIIGGSKHYTGAPYFAAITALKVGCDLSHVFCAKDASQVIKSYSPELIVHPTLDNPGFMQEFMTQIPLFHSLVIGPGLGRELHIFNATSRVIQMGKNYGLPLVFDADALYYLKDCHDDIKGYKRAILTPNKVEFARLFTTITGKELTGGESTIEDVQELAQRLGNVTIVKKGPQDVISDGIITVFCDEPGSPRRCGGQGDLLSGAMGVFNFWAFKYYKSKNEGGKNFTVLAALAACMLTRRCSYLAFQKCKRSTLTTDMIAEINEAFSSLFSK